MKEDRVSNEEVSLDELKRRLAEFAKDRNWDKFHSPRNLLLALATPFWQVGEKGEPSEIFQWKGEVPRGLPDWEEEKQRVGEALSDVLLYLVRLSDICGGIDLDNAALGKLELNAIKSPVKPCKKGTSVKCSGMHKGNTATNWKP